MMPCTRNTFVTVFMFGVLLVLYYMYELQPITISSGRGFAPHQTDKFRKDISDVFAFIHVQKTGGTTMEKHFVRNIENSNCKCENTKRPACNCYRSDNKEVWLLCRYNIPKWPCGLHPDYATLRDCAPRFMDAHYGRKKRRYFYGTILRDPVSRLLSEFRHVQRGATWSLAGAMCQGKMLTQAIPKCHNSTKWKNLDLKTFLSCRSNLAWNRQTWMHSNLSLVGCDFANIMEDSYRKEQLLEIAQRNLQSMDYIALLEYPVESQFVFEKTFNMDFKEPFQKWQTGFAHEYLNSSPEAKELMDMLLRWNDLDIRLYEFSKNELFRRYRSLILVHGLPVYQKPLPNSSFNPNFSKKYVFDTNISWTLL